MTIMSIEESRNTIVLDFDGVLHDYDEWRGAEVIGEPVEGALDFVWWLKERGYGLRIISVRAAHEGGKVAIQEWLKKHGFPKISVSHEKKGGCLYIDDRAIRFEGDFDQMYQYLADNPNPGRWGLKDGSDS